MTEELKYDILDEYSGLKYTTVTLSNKPEYTTTFNLANVQITMRCGYNSRNGMRWIYLLDKNGRVLLRQTFIKYGKRCELGFRANQRDLDYYVTLKPKDLNNIKDNPDYLNWAQSFDLCFVGYEQSLTNKIQENLVGILVSDGYISQSIVRPPEPKYASHLYPTYAVDRYQSTGVVATSGSLAQMYSVYSMREEYTSDVTATTSVLQQVFFNYNITVDTESYQSSGVSAKNALLQQTYFYTSHTQPNEFYQSNGVSAKTSQLTQTYFLTQHTQPYEYFGSTGVAAKTSQLTKVA